MLLESEVSMSNSIVSEASELPLFSPSSSSSSSTLVSLASNGGLFLESSLPVSFVSLISSRSNPTSSDSSSSSSFSGTCCKRVVPLRVVGYGFLSVSLSTKIGDGLVQESDETLKRNGEKSLERKMSNSGRGRAVNATKHLWAGAFAAMVSRTFVAPLERLKLEYIVRGEQRNLFELIKTIGTTQGIKGFWKGNFLNILRTAPFKAINFYAFDTYRKQLLILSGHEETTNFERILAGAAAGITASMLCFPMDTIRTKIIAPGGDALGGIFGAFHHMIQAEGFFSLYKGIVPSLISMAPAGAVFYGMYDILKSAYLRSPEGKKRIQQLNQHGQELNALDQLELGPVRTLLYGAISGACAEAATYPFEIVRRHLQMQGQATKLNALATFLKIVEQGGVPALYAGLLPSLLQVLPSAGISYFVYECMKIVFKVS